MLHPTLLPNNKTDQGTKIFSINSFDDGRTNILDPVSLPPINEFLYNGVVVSNPQFISIVVINNTSSLDNEKSELKNKIIRSLDRYSDYDFESGSDEHIKVELETFITEYEEIFFSTFSEIIYEYKLSEIFINEVLIQIGMLDNNISFIERTRFLQLMLFNKSLHIRDGAVQGLSYLNNKSSITSLKSALEKEQNKFLKSDIKELINIFDE